MVILRPKRQVYANLGRALAAADAGPEHVARITIYVVDYERDKCSVWRRCLRAI